MIQKLINLVAKSSSVHGLAKRAWVLPSTILKGILPSIHALSDGRTAAKSSASLKRLYRLILSMMFDDGARNA